ncbi:MAG: glycoside hydrolase family 13 protein, partial [Corallococcus sp.]|nr:glycoside hydrolase family 13 protein [Corallococcus sp.]
MLVKYNPTESRYKSIVGAVPRCAAFAVSIEIDKIMNPSSVRLRVYGDGAFLREFATVKVEKEGNYDCYTADVSVENKGLYYYYFYLDGVPYEHFVGRGADDNACLFYDNVQSWQLSVYDKRYSSPSWLYGGVMYQIMVDRFCRKGDTFKPDGERILRKWGEQPYYKAENGEVKNRDFFGGNLAGVISKLPYLKSLGVSVIYLNPVFSARSNHKYDTNDYEKIDECFGTEEDFAALCDFAKKRGIKIVLDGVFNHTGNDSKYFRSAVECGGKSPYADWFTVDADGNYESWWGFKTLPRINPESLSARRYFCGENGIVGRYLERGASGWRLDVVDELSDGMLDAIVKSAKSALPDAAVIGEVWEDASNKISYGARRHYLDGSQLDTVMNYPLKDALICFVRDGNAEALRRTAFAQLNNYPSWTRNALMNILGTHDTERILTALVGKKSDGMSKDEMAQTRLSDAEYARAVHLLKLCAVLQYTFYGFPCVYYGDEVG